MSERLTERPGTLRLLAVTALAVILLAGVAQLPRQWRMFVQPALPVVRQWADTDAQHRLQYDGSYNLLRAVEEIVPQDATVLLVTSGHDVRGREYRLFHRALYLLAPRPVWWQSPAPSDGTWESNWWIATPVDASSVLATAATHGADFVLAADLFDLELPGRRLLDRSDGYLVQLNQGQPAPTPLSLPSFQARDAWPLRLGGALFVVWAMGDALLALAAWANRRHRGPGWQPPAGIERLALTWIHGSGLLSLAMLGLDRLELTLNGQVVTLSVLAAMWLGWRLWQRRRGPAPPIRRPTFPRRAARSAGAALLIALITVQLLLAGVLAVGQPLAGWDSWTSWGMRARTIFLEGGITPSVVADPSRAVTRPGYPLLTPLLQAWLYRWLDAADDRLAGLVLWLFFAALVGLVYGAVLRRSHNRLFALLAAAAAGPSPGW